MNKTNYSDVGIFNAFALGETTEIKRFNEEKTISWLKEFSPSNITDLAILYAMDRPLAEERIPLLIKKKNGLLPVFYRHPMLIPFFECSFGIPVFPEQWMDFAREVAGMSGEKVEKLRIAMGKKHLTMLSELKPEFVDGLKQNDLFTEGIENIEEIIETIWNDWYDSAVHLFKRLYAYKVAIAAYQKMLINKK